MKRFGRWTHQRRATDGRFRKTTLEDLGVAKDEINMGPIVCSVCKREWDPIIRQDPCFDCQAAKDSAQEGASVLVQFQLLAPKRDTISSIDQTCSVTPALTAGVQRIA